MTTGAAPIPFGEMFSAAPEEEVNAANRVDPFYRDLWIGGSRISWISRSMAERRQAAGMGRMYYDDHRLSAEQGRKKLLAKGSLRVRRLSTLAAAGMWRTASGEQIAAIVGDPRAARRADDLPAGFSASLLERGRFPNLMLDNPDKTSISLYRPLEGATFERFSRNLTYEEWVSVTAGYPYRAGSQYDRHNLLATEFALRVAEFCPVGSVVGESLSGFTLIAPDHAVPRGSRTRAADLVIIRPDGMKIAVELTASTGSDFETKVGKWVDMLSDIDPAQDGLSVLFLEAERRERHGDLTRSITRTVEKVVFAKFGARRKRIPHRVAVARWQDWFPQVHHGSPDFYTLKCLRPTGSGDQLWQPAELLTENDVTYEPSDPRAARAVLRNLNGVWGVPHWLRDPSQAPDLMATMMRKAGVKTIPSPAKKTRA